jgi:muramoyltetrapeptide carboxypeptidase
VAVVAPASRPDPEALEAGIEALRARSLRVQAGRHVLDAYGHLAGQDRDRAADLMGAFLDPEVRGIFCARGGSGSARTFPYLDLSAIAAHPKVFVGYSDVTVLHLAIARAGGWPTFYGPMVASEMEGCRNDACFDALWRLIACPEPAGSLSAGSDVGACRALVPGVAEGRLTGGTLCLVESSLGTPYSIRTRGRILALEDENEASWRVDRMLTHLVQSGLLEGVAGFLIGSLSGDEHGGAAGELSVTQSLRDHLGSLGKPVLCGFPFGHIATPLTLPLGVRCRLDAGAGTISALEPAVDARA